MPKSAEIQYLLKLKGKKQKDVADQLGVTPATISQIINGRRRSRRIAKAIARMLGKPHKTLFGEQAA